MLERKLDPTQKKKVHNLKQLIKNTPASKYINLLAGFCIAVTDKFYKGVKN